MLKKISKILSLMLVLFGLLSSMAMAVPKEMVELDIYGINDLRGALRRENDQPGVAELGGVINKLRAENPTGTILLGGGNMVFGSVESDDRNGIPTVNVMNAMGYRVSPLEVEQCLSQHPAATAWRWSTSANVWPCTMTLRRGWKRMRWRLPTAGASTMCRLSCLVGEKNRDSFCGLPIDAFRADCG